MSKFIYLLMTSVFTLLIGCAPSYYAPNSNNIPLFAVADESHFSVSGSYSQDVKGMELQYARSFMKGHALMLNYYEAGTTHDRMSRNYFSGKGRYGEAAYGYYKTFEDFQVEGFAGGGYGSYTISGPYQRSAFTTNIAKLFVQPDVGVRSDYVDFGFAPRMSLIHYLDVETKGRDMNADAAYIQAHPVSFLIEPGMVIRTGIKKVRIQLRYTFSKNLSHPAIRQQQDNLSLGLFLDL